MSIYYQTENVRVRKRDEAVYLVAVICDECDAQYLHADTHEYDTAKAIDEAVYCGGWMVQDNAEHTAKCERCVMSHCAREVSP